MTSEAALDVPSPVAEAQSASPASIESPMRTRLRKILKWVVGLALLPYALILLYAIEFVHPVSTLMAWRSLRGAPMQREWIDLGAMSPSLPRSVIAAEDAHFCKHHGIDWGALREAIDDAREDGTAFRGASTITQQVAKNLFLWPGRSFVRKALEFPLALWIDFILPKKRILELYLNVAELGPTGQFGADAGARYAFGRPASALSAHEAALLASILPNPVIRSARKPGPGVRRLASTYALRARSAEISDCWGRNR